jgi:type III pantothenate kinase
VENLTFKGAIIAPGLMTSKNALISKTSLLPQVVLEIPSKLLGTNSSDSIKSGLIYGHASMIDGIIRRIFEQIGTEDIPVILTGGNAKLIYPQLKEKMILDEGLILKGLLSVYKRNLAK